MSWHKTNLALMFILAAIDIFLAVMLFDAYRSSRLLPEKLITEAQTNLASKGVDFDETVIDKGIYTKTVYTYSTGMLFAEEMEENAAQSHPRLISALSYLSGQSEQTVLETAQYFDIPSGTSISVFDRSGNAAGTAAISGTTGFEYSAASFDSERISSKADELLLSAPNAVKTISCPKPVSDFFKEVYNGSAGAKALLSREHEGGTLTLCLLTIGELDIIDMPICFYTADGKIIYAKGNIFFSDPESAYTAKLIDGINILYKLPGQYGENISISSERMVYSCVNYENEQYIVPSWEIYYTLPSDQTNSVSRCILDALTGAATENIAE